jgi:hypothetical protein
MNPASSNLLTSCQMTSCLSAVYLLSFCLISLNDGSILNLCSITSLEIPGISDIFYVKHLDFFRKKVTSMNSYLRSRFELIRSFLSGLLGSVRISLSSSTVIPFCLLSTFSVLQVLEGYYRLVASALKSYEECCHPGRLAVCS